MADPGWFLTELMQASFKGYPIVCDKVSHQKNNSGSTSSLGWPSPKKQWQLLDPRRNELKFSKWYLQYPKRLQGNSPGVMPSAFSNYIYIMIYWSFIVAILRCPATSYTKFAVEASNHVGHIIGGTLGKDSAAYSYHGRKKNGGSSRSTMVKDCTGR